MAETETLFTKIINGEIPCHKIYEDERTFAFLDIHPVQPGHTLVIAKNPTEFVWDLPEEDYLALMATTQKIARHLREKLDKPYIGSKIIGTDVPHNHVHLIPFATGEGLHHQPDFDAEPDHEALKAMADKLAITVQ